MTVQKSMALWKQNVFGLEFVMEVKNREINVVRLVNVL